MIQKLPRQSGLRLMTEIIDPFDLRWRQVMMSQNSSLAIGDHSAVHRQNVIRIQGVQRRAQAIMRPPGRNHENQSVLLGLGDRFLA